MYIGQKYFRTSLVEGYKYLKSVTNLKLNKNVSIWEILEMFEIILEMFEKFLESFETILETFLKALENLKKFLKSSKNSVILKFFKQKVKRC